MSKTRWILLEYPQILLIFLYLGKSNQTLHLFLDFSRYLNEIHQIDMPPNQQWHCNISMTMLVICQYCSTLFILFMTFERFYSIIRPHKAASFNTVKRAKITISCIVCFSSFVCIPNLFLTLTIGRSCFIFGKGMTLEFMKIYQWVRVAFAFLLPFLLLLIMNSFIIHTLRNRSSLFKLEEDDSSYSSNHRNNRKQKPSEKQVYITLLAVTFSFLQMYEYHQPNLHILIYFKLK